MTLFLAGDVMIGRGIDQVLPRPCDPMLYECYVKSASVYVALAELANGPISQPVDVAYVWGDALIELDRVAPDLRLINLETAITRSTDWDPKGINYRMNPDNADVITAAGIDGCVLANNHTLDWGPDGLVETLETLRRIRVVPVGAGRMLCEARSPAAFPTLDGRVVVFAFGSPTSGVPETWAATEDRPGVNFLSDLTPRTLDDVARQVAAERRPGDIVVVSLHWGPNWGYDVTRQQTAFAHALIDRIGVDIVWGHSSHHPKAIEVHHGKLILYGCGDLLNDYEGIAGYEAFRDDLVLMYFPTIARKDGMLLRLDMVPLQIRNFRLSRVSRADAEWLRNVLSREGRKVGTRVELGEDGRITVCWS